MSTENGAITGSKARHHISYLRDRLEWLEHFETVNGYQQAEIMALEWAIPVLEAEADWADSRHIYAKDPRDYRSLRCPACGARPVGLESKGATYGVQVHPPTLAKAREGRGTRPGASDAPTLSQVPGPGPHHHERGQ